jgi:hypothetical protein
VRAALLLVATLGLAQTAQAESQAPDVDDANPAAALGSETERDANPMRTGAVLMELIERADAALKAKDGARAVRYFEAVVSAVPEQALGHRKLCEARSVAGDVEGAIQACRAALQREGSTVSDHLRHLALVVARSAEPRPDDIVAVDQSLSHLEETRSTTADALDLSCQLALRLGDSERLSTCVQRFESLVPNDSRSAAYGWAEAMRAHDESSARVALDRARVLGHDPQKLEEMKLAMRREFPARNWWYWAAGSVALVGLGLLARIWFRTTPRRPTPRSLEHTT